MLSNTDVIATAVEMEKDARVEWARLRRFERYARGKQKGPWLPDSAETEYRDIAKKSASNWVELVVRALVQGLFIDGYSDEDVWAKAWQANGYDARQAALNRSVFTLGYSFNIVLPAEEPGSVWMRPEAATNMYAVYADPHDEWPLRALRVVSKDRWEVYDDEARYTIIEPKGAQRVTVLEHELEVTPVVQLRAALDLMGTPMGEVEPVMPIQDRIVDATFNLQMVAKYGAFPQRWIAGLNPGEPLRDADGNPLLDGDGNPIFPKIKAYIDHILMASDENTKFGQFAAADLNQYVAALETHIRHLAAITQTPPHYLLGSLVNLSAEALAAAESGLQRKLVDKRQVLGEGYEQTLRLAAAVLDLEDAALDTSSQVSWRDVESRSLAQTSDALLKLNQLGVPLSYLVTRIPGITQQDIEEIRDAISEGDPMTGLVDRLNAAAADDPAALAAKANALGMLIRAGVSPESAQQQVGLDGLDFTGAIPVSLRVPEAAAASLESS